MSARLFTALGTSSLVPSKTRNHNGYFLRWGQTGILFDPGEGTQRQLTYAGISARSISVICVTHLHGDHCLGLPGVLQRISLDQVPHPVTLIFPAESQDYIERLHRASIFYDQADIRYLPVETGDEPTEILRTRDVILSAAALNHRVPTIGFRIEDHPDVSFIPEALAERGITGPTIGRLRKDGQITINGVTTRIEEVTRPREGHSFAFVMDTTPCPGATALARDVDLHVMEATYTSEVGDMAHEHGHCTAADAARTATEAGAKRLALTHYSTRYTSSEGHAAEAGALHPNVVALADFDCLEF
ncbi:MAG: MBL fold metallo-hydrolase [Actinomycetaceae bacterium]|nr:MBL fold metallo-hydrolase [Actinomycetaceae bacterium]